MKKIEAYVRPNRLENVKQALGENNVQGLSVTEVVGGGKGARRRIMYRGTEAHADLQPQAKLEIVVQDHLVENIIDVIRGAARTGESGDGKIFVYAVEEAIRIRTGERGEEAI